MAHSTPSTVPAQRHSAPAGRRLKIAICGSFRRDPEGLRAVHRKFLDAGATVLSPVDPAFIHEEDGFVYAAHEVGERAARVEERHIRAMLEADFVWLYAPDGYVGSSAAMELGFAHALGVPVYCDRPPTDAVFSDLVKIVAAPEEAVAARTPRVAAQDAPTRSLGALQEYYRRAAADRGWSDETPQDTLLLLSEELGELARALRKTRNGRVESAGEDPALELADVALYVVHLANVLAIDLGRAVLAKEQINAERFAPDHAAKAA